MSSSSPKLARLVPQVPGQQPEEFVHISSFARVKNAEDEMLLVKKTRPEFTAGKWVFPSSVINFGEDPKLAIERIIREQVGASPGSVKLIDVQSFGDKHWDLCFVYDVSVDKVGKLSSDIEVAGYFNRKKLPPEFRSDHLEVLETLEKNMAGDDEFTAVKEWYRYNSYVRKKYLDVLEKLPEAEVTRDRGASFPTMIDIVAHTLDAYMSWLYRYKGKPYEPSSKMRGKVRSVRQLREEEKRVDSTVLNFVEGLQPADLDNTFQTFNYGPLWEGRTWQITLRQMLWHMVEEELQHRGELNALLWQIDVDAPVFDWLDWKLELGEIKQLQ